MVCVCRRAMTGAVNESPRNSNKRSASLPLIDSLCRSHCSLCCASATECVVSTRMRRVSSQQGRSSSSSSQPVPRRPLGAARVAHLTRLDSRCCQIPTRSHHSQIIAFEQRSATSRVESQRSEWPPLLRSARHTARCRGRRGRQLPPHERRIETSTMRCCRLHLHLRCRLRLTRPTRRP